MILEASTYFAKKIQAFSDADLRVFARKEVDPASVKTVHLIGVCGTAVGSLAKLFVEAGFIVSGSDTECYPPMSDLIRDLGITLYEGFSSNHLVGKDLIIVGNVSGPTNEESQVAREQGLAQLSLSEAIQIFFIKNRQSLVVCGTHGKTTTTGMLSHVLYEGGFDPGFLVGGVMGKGNTDLEGISSKVGNMTKGDKGFFVVEGDEYDTAYFDKAPKFLHYLAPHAATSAIVTSLEFDHADIYKDLDDYRQSFIFLAKSLLEKDLFILNADHEETLNLQTQTKAHVITYGRSTSADVQATKVTTDSTGQHFNLIYKGKDLGTMSLQLFGRYNVDNALAVCAIALHHGMLFETLQKVLGTFKGMKRRQEIVGEKEGVIVIDDFAHHPTAVVETLKGIREHFPHNRIIALFEPRSNTSRRKIFEYDYGNSFTSADIFYLSMPKSKEGDDMTQFIDGEVVINEAKKSGVTESFLVHNAEEVLEKLLPTLKEGDVVVGMSNASFDGIHKKILERL